MSIRPNRRPIVCDDDCGADGERGESEYEQSVYEDVEVEEPLDHAPFEVEEGLGQGVLKKGVAVVGNLEKEEICQHDIP